VREDPPTEPDRIEGVSAAVLAGGESRRFGRSKAHALLGGRPLIDHVLRPLQRLFTDVSIIAHRPEAFERFDVDVAADLVRGPGALGGLLTALVHARKERCFVVACDMPFLREEVIRRMAQQARWPDVLLPVWRGERQPLHAFYARRCIPFIRRAIGRGDFRIIDFYDEITVREVEEEIWLPTDPAGTSFFNVNTPEDFETAAGWFQERGDGPERTVRPERTGSGSGDGRGG